MKTKIYRTIREIPKEDWEAIYPVGPRNYHLFKSIDESGFKGLRHYYIIVHDQNAPVGAAPCFLFNYPLETTIEGPLKNILYLARRAFPGSLNLKALICGLPYAEGSIGINRKNPEPVLRAILAAMEKIARHERASILAFKDFTEEFTPFLDSLTRNHKFHKVESYPSVELDIDFPSFEDYMARLSHATRKDLRRKFKKVGRLPEIAMEVADNASGVLGEIYDLYMQTFLKSSVKFEEVSRDFFTNISRHMPEHSKYFLWRVNGRLVAFNFCLVSEDTVMDEYIGLDYSVAYDYGLYFITFRDVINWCIANKITKYKSGAMTYEPKKRLKCSFIPCYVYIRHMNRFVNPLFKFMCAALRPENFDDVLKDMKETKNPLLAHQG